jgi:hypothetical protein
MMLETMLSLPNAGRSLPRCASSLITNEKFASASAPLTELRSYEFVEVLGNPETGESE